MNLEKIQSKDKRTLISCFVIIVRHTIPPSPHTLLHSQGTVHRCFSMATEASPPRDQARVPCTRMSLLHGCRGTCCTGVCCTGVCCTAIGACCRGLRHGCKSAQVVDYRSLQHACRGLRHNFTGLRHNSKSPQAASPHCRQLHAAEAQHIVITAASGR